MASLFVTVGIVCSGKTNFVKSLSKETGAYVVSVGDMRKDLKTKNPDISEKTIFDEVYEAVRTCLAYGYDCILDGTFIKESRRENIFNVLSKIMPGIPYKKCCIVIATPIEQVFYNNIKKGKRFPNELIKKMYMEWETPGYWEGWDEIWAYYENPKWIGCNGDYGDFPEAHLSTDLNDKDYFSSLGGHCNSVYNHLLRLLQTRDPKGKDELREKSLLNASLIHDCGKPVVETKEEGKSLYYNHSNVGAYEALFYNIDTGADSIYVSDLVNYHMDPYEWEKADSARAYAVKDYGGEFVEDLSLLHQADEMAKENT